MSKLPGIPKRIDVSSWFCFNVRTGSLIIGWYGLLLSIAYIFGTSALCNLIIWDSNYYEFQSPDLLKATRIFAHTIVSSNLLIAFINGAMIAGVMEL
ncbi:hypothetical protein HCN44_002450 [Aphidius gifuensis]|uniref:Uncharacterized protein n=1 Tax=Aphidius gifuensis TaxID=684658 RepID=A0A834Y440_APHGI|nr:hypothetical protein HCN44_002450 [Aphidius gifuensis]